MHTAYTTGKPNIVPLGMANANSMIPGPYKDEVTEEDLASLDDPRLVKVGAGGLMDKMSNLRGELAQLAKMGLPILEQMQSGFSSNAILQGILGAVGGNTMDIKIDMGGIVVNGAGDPEATARAVFRHADQDMRFIAANRLGGNHGLVSI
jgi:hypothetical protein